MSVWEDFNVVKQCRNLRVRLLECPNFLFLLMGAVIIISILISYLIANRYIDDSLAAALIVLIVAAVMMVIAFLIIRSFNAMVEANMFKSEFINIISHEIRSPLTSLKWSVSLLQKSGLSNDEFEYFDAVKEGTNKIIDLVQILNDVGKIELGQIQFNKGLFDVIALTQELLKDYQPLIEEKKIKIIFNYDKDLPKILIDADKLKLVIKNLIDNAVRYNKDGGEVNVNISKENSYINWRIEDTGVGISQDQRKMIFQKFFRASNAMRYQTRGLGLGLFISKHFIEAMGGKIYFKSVDDRGSVFWFKLPIA